MGSAIILDNLKILTNILQSMDCACWLNNETHLGVLKSDFLDFRMVADLYYRLMEKGFEIRRTVGSLNDFFIIVVEREEIEIVLEFYYDHGEEFVKNVLDMDDINRLYVKKSNILPLQKIDNLFYPARYVGLWRGEKI